MTHRAYYCSKWSGHRKQPIEMWDEARARNAHDKGKRYTALIGSPVQPICAVEVVPETDFIGVYFFDPYLRIYLRHIFLRQPDGKLFLSEVISRKFIEEFDTISGGTDYVFNKDGTVKIIEYIGQLVQVGTGTYDISKNYDSYPMFGDYDEIIKIDRE
jgi:hypothetical protein